MNEIAKWIVSSGLADALSGPEWLTPLVQALHIISIAAIIGAVLMMCLRFVGLMRMDTTLSDTCTTMFPIFWYGLLCTAISGFVLVCGQPERELMNSLFRIKMLVVVIGVISMILVHSRFRAHWSGGAELVGTSARLVMVALVLLWLCVIALGRWIAYF